jgi:hypothetical protein
VQPVSKKNCPCRLRSKLGTHQPLTPFASLLGFIFRGLLGVRYVMPMCGDVMASDGLVDLRQRHGGGEQMASVWTLEPSPERAPRARACFQALRSSACRPPPGQGSAALPSSESPTSSRALPAAGRYPSPHPVVVRRVSCACNQCGGLACYASTVSSIIIANCNAAIVRGMRLQSSQSEARSARFFLLRDRSFHGAIPAAPCMSLFWQDARHVFDRGGQSNASSHNQQ